MNNGNENVNAWQLDFKANRSCQFKKLDFNQLNADNQTMLLFKNKNKTQC